MQTLGRIVLFPDLDFKERKGLAYREKCWGPRVIPSLRVGFGNEITQRYDAKIQL